MSNVHGLYSGNNKADDDDDPNSDQEERYVGGVDSRGGGSGLAVEPNPDSSSADSLRHAILGRATAASAQDDSSTTSSRRRTITMYRDGFTVDDGAYRRLDDPNNAEFLRSLASGRTPRELVQDDEGQVNPDIIVNLIDKRSEDYQETFRSFSGAGATLGGGSSGDAASQEGADGVFGPNADPSAPSTDPDPKKTTSIQVRLLNGQRMVVRIALSATISELAAMLPSDTPFRLVSGFPPKPLQSGTVEENGLKGAQVVMKKA